MILHRPGYSILVTNFVYFLKKERTRERWFIYFTGACLTKTTCFPLPFPTLHDDRVRIFNVCHCFMDTVAWETIILTPVLFLCEKDLSRRLKLVPVKPEVSPLRQGELCFLLTFPRRCHSASRSRAARML